MGLLPADRVPMAHTCAFQLMIPDVSSLPERTLGKWRHSADSALAASMLGKLRLALAYMGAGFQIG